MEYEQIPALEGDGAYLGYEDEEDDGYDGEFEGEEEGEYESGDEYQTPYAMVAGDDIGAQRRRRMVRRPRRRVQVRPRRAPRGHRPAAPPRRRKKVKFVKDSIISVVATGVAGTVSQTDTITDEFICHSASFDGSAATAKITGLTFHKRQVFGPFATAKAVPASAFSGTSQKTLSLQGYKLFPTQTVTLSGIIANDNDVLQMLLFGKEVVGQNNC